MPFTLSRTRTGVIGDLAYWQGTATFDSSYAELGESFTASNAGMSDIYKLFASLRNPGNNQIYWDDTNSKLKLYATVYEIDSGENAIINHNATTADGVAVYVHVDSNPGIAGAAIGHLEFVSPTNVDGFAVVGADATEYTLRIKDNDAAATNGFALRARPTGAGFQADMDLAPVVTKVYIPIAGADQTDVAVNDIHFGAALSVEDIATSGTSVAVLFDEDGANAFERFEVNAADAADETADIVVPKPGLEVPSGTDCSKCVVDVFAIGRP